MSTRPKRVHHHFRGPKQTTKEWTGKERRAGTRCDDQNGHKWCKMHRLCPSCAFFSPFFLFLLPTNIVLYRLCSMKYATRREVEGGDDENGHRLCRLGRTTVTTTWRPQAHTPISTCLPGPPPPRQMTATATKQHTITMNGHKWQTVQQGQGSERRRRNERINGGARDATRLEPQVCFLTTFFFALELMITYRYTLWMTSLTNEWLSLARWRMECQWLDDLTTTRRNQMTTWDSDENGGDVSSFELIVFGILFCMQLLLNHTILGYNWCRTID